MNLGRFYGLRWLNLPRNGELAPLICGQKIRAKKAIRIFVIRFGRLLEMSNQPANQPDAKN
jgi:hypothetical protein